MSLSGSIQIANQDIFRTSTTKLHKLGTPGVSRDGRVFRYGLAGAVALSPGKLNTAPAVVANHQNIAVATAAAVGDQDINLTLGATATTANQYDDGYVVGYDVAGVGQALQINGTPVLASSASGRFLLSDPVAIALTTSSKVNLEQNPWSAQIVAPTSATGDLVTGVANVSVAAASYGWFQTRGHAAVLGNGSITKGTGLVQSATTAGAVDAEAAASVGQRVGLAVQTGASTKYNTVYLSID
jgi:hypothetical protein